MREDSGKGGGGRRNGGRERKEGDRISSPRLFRHTLHADRVPQGAPSTAPDNGCWAVGVSSKPSWGRFGALVSRLDGGLITLGADLGLPKDGLGPRCPHLRSRSRPRGPRASSPDCRIIRPWLELTTGIRAPPESLVKWQQLVGLGWGGVGGWLDTIVIRGEEDQPRRTFATNFVPA